MGNWVKLHSEMIVYKSDIRLRSTSIHFLVLVQPWNMYTYNLNGIPKIGAHERYFPSEMKFKQDLNSIQCNFEI